MKIIVAGGRNNHLTRQDKRYLINLVETNKLTTLVCGMAKGIDIEAYNLLKDKVDVLEFPAKWSDLNVEPCIVKENKYGQYNALAGHNRNRQMAEIANGVVLFKGNSGTLNMRELAKEYNLEILRDDNCGQ